LQVIIFQNRVYMFAHQQGIVDAVPFLPDFYFLVPGIETCHPGHGHDHAGKRQAISGFLPEGLFSSQGFGRIVVKIEKVRVQAGIGQVEGHVCMFHIARGVLPDKSRHRR